MAVAPLPGFCGPSYTARSRVPCVEMSMNWFAERIESEGAKNRYSLLPTPGLTSFGSSSLSPWRAAFSQEGRSFGVIGYGFVEVNSDGTFTNRGTVDLDSNPATISGSGDLGNELFITSGGKGYTFDLLTNTLTEIAGLSAVMGGYLSGFFLALGDDNTVRISAYGDGLTWDPTQFRSRAAASDRWVAMLVVGQVIWFWGTKSYEIWYNAGTSPFPFQLIPGQVYNQGIAAPFSATNLGDTAAWLSANDQGQGLVFVGEQYTPRRVSNFAVEWQIQDYARQGMDISTVVGMAYQEDGHPFLSLTFGGDIDHTWVYDQSTGQWHERGQWVMSATDPSHFGAWQPQYHMFAYGKHLVGLRNSGQLCEMGSHLYSDVGDAPIRRVRRAPCVFNQKQGFEVHLFELDMTVGIGLQSGQGSDPHLMFRRSWDGGYTYGNEFQLAVGAVGKRSTRVRRTRLGSGTDLVVEVSVTDPVPWGIANAYLDATPAAY